LDASGDVPRDAAEDALPEPQHCLGEDAEKLADRGLDVPAQSARLVRAERSTQMARAAPYTPDEVRCGGRSCAAAAFADALAQLAPLVSRLRESAVAAAARASQKPEQQTAKREASQLLAARTAPVLAASPEVRQRMVAGLPVALVAQKMSASG